MSAPLRYISLFSGIEAWSRAVEGMPEFVPAAFAETAPFPCAVLQARYPDVPNLGDVRKIDGRPFRGSVDLVVGGSPCQDFSVSGAMKGLDGSQSVLAIEYVRLLKEIQPMYFIWENVPGSMSANGGNDLRRLLEAFQEAGYLLDLDVLDALDFGTPQRRRRLFAVGVRYAGMLARRGQASGILAAKCLLQAMGRMAEELDGMSGRESFVPAEAFSAGLRKRLDFVLRKGMPRREQEDLLAALDAPAAGLAALPECAGEAAGLPKAWKAALGKIRRMPGVRKEIPMLKAWSACAGAALAAGSLLAMELLHGKSRLIDAADLEPLWEIGEHAGQAGGKVSEEFGSAGLWADLVREAGMQKAAFRRAGAAGGGGQPLSAFAEGMRGDTGKGRPQGQDGAGGYPAGAGGGGAEGSGFGEPELIAFAQNQRSEVRKLSAAGALAAEPGMQQQTFIMQLKRPEAGKLRQIDVHPGPC